MKIQEQTPKRNHFLVSSGKKKIDFIQQLWKTRKKISKARELCNSKSLTTPFWLVNLHDDGGRATEEAVAAAATRILQTRQREGNGCRTESNILFIMSFCLILFNFLNTKFCCHTISSGDCYLKIQTGAAVIARKSIVLKPRSIYMFDSKTNLKLLLYALLVYL